MTQHSKRGRDGRFVSNSGVVTVKSKKKKGMGRLVPNPLSPKARLRNHVVIVLDNSGSMSSLAATVRAKYLELIQNLASNSITHNQDTVVTLYTFGSDVQQIYAHRNVHDLVGLPVNEYNAWESSTRLFDSVQHVVNYAQSIQEYRDNNTSFLVLVLTDGRNNAGLVSAKQAQDFIKGVVATGRWTYTFQVPPNHKQDLVNLGISSDNVIEWETTKEGLEQTFRTTAASFDNYYSGRTRGVKASTSFFVQPDLSNKTKEIKKLNDVSSDFHLLEAKKEEVIRPFIESKFGHYNIGSAYYLLQKTEKVQSNKDVVLMDKFNKKMYGGRQARDIIGLPHNADAKVEPGNHGAYDIFVQSTSVNRKIPRGSKILVRA